MSEAQEREERVASKRRNLAALLAMFQPKAVEQSGESYAATLLKKAATDQEVA